MSATRFFEDFQVGETWSSSPTVVTEADIVAFGRSYDPQPMHTDPAVASASPFGGLIASGWHIASLSVRVFVESGGYGKTPVVGLGIDQLRWHRSVRAGDKLTFTREVVEVRRSSSSPGHGILRTRVTACNQHGESVMTLMTAGRVPARDTSTAAADLPDESTFIPFSDLFASHARSDPTGIALRDDEGSLTWQAFHERVARIARALVASGVKPGDRVALFGAMTMDSVVCMFGVVAARACAVPLPTSASSETLAAMRADCGATILLIDSNVGDLGAELALQHETAHPGRVVRFGASGPEGDEFEAWCSHGAADIELPMALKDDAFNIIYSSGTTGMPKGIVHLHGMRQALAVRGGFGFAPHSRTLLSTPIYSNTTLTPLLGSLAHGGTTILMRKFDASRFLELAAQWRVTHTMLVPVQYQRLLAQPDFDRHDLTALVLSQSTGAPMSAGLKRELLERWPGRLREAYGLTEGGVSCYLDVNAHPDKLDTVGQAGHGTEVFVIDEAGRKLGVGATGEIVGRSPFMMARYHNRPDATEAIRWLDDAGRMYHRSGDIGRFDEEGFLTLLDRRKDVIISGGHNIYAADLEAVINRHADVRDCAVIGIPSAAWGETPLALVVAQPGSVLDPLELRDWINGRLGSMQRLAAVELRDDLQRSALGKLSKALLRAPYWKKENAQ